MAARLVAFDHVQVPIPPEGEEAARPFYSGILGLREIAKPEPLVSRGGCWFSDGVIQIHLGIEPGFNPSKKAHAAFIVEGIDEILARCVQAGVETRSDVPVLGYRRINVFDPFGNRFELMERIKAT